MSGTFKLYNQRLPDRQIHGLRSLKEQTGISAAELLRRMLDHCFQVHVLNQIVPAMSGQMNVGR